MSAIGAEGRKQRERFVETDVAVSVPPTVKEAAQAAKSLDGAALDKTGKGGVLKDHTFSLDYTDSRGRLWSGEFKCHALTYREKITVGLIRSRLSGGVAAHMLDVTTANLLEMLAHLTVAIDSGPEWAKKLEDLHDPGVVIAIYEGVSGHEARFLGAGPEGFGTADDAGPGPDDGAGLDAADG